MRKIILIAMSILAVVALTACGSKTPVETTTQATETEPVETEYVAPEAPETVTGEDNLPSLEDVYGKDWAWQKYDNKEEAENVVGITLEAPFFGNEKYVTYYASKGQERIRIWYLNIIEDGESIIPEDLIVCKHYTGAAQNESSTIEEQEAETDTTNNKVVSINGNDVVMTMDGDNVVYAAWSIDDYEYTLKTTAVNFTVDDAAAYIAQVK